MPIHIIPTITPADHNPVIEVNIPSRKVIIIVDPLTKLGADVVTVDLILVPNCSEVVVINTAHKPPIGIPNKNMML